MILCAAVLVVVCTASVLVLWWLRARLAAVKSERGACTLALSLHGLGGEGVEAVRALIVTAHPDDECMFFAPTILALSAKCTLFLLCLSEGRCALHLSSSAGRSR